MEWKYSQKVRYLTFKCFLNMWSSFVGLVWIPNFTKFWFCGEKTSKEKKVSRNKLSTQNFFEKDVRMVWYNRKKNQSIFQGFCLKCFFLGEETKWRIINLKIKHAVSQSSPRRTFLLKTRPYYNVTGL